MVATGPIATFGGITAGSNYDDGTYIAIPLSGGTGSRAQANITVASGAVTAVDLPSLNTHAILDRTGMNYIVGDVLTAADTSLGASGSGFSVPVATLAAACENCFFGKIVPVVSGGLFAGQRYCAREAFANIQAAQSHNYQPLITPDDFWCGDGADLVLGASFAASVYNIPSVSAIQSVAWNINDSPTISSGSGSFNSVSGNFNWIALGKGIAFVCAIVIPAAGNGTAGTYVQVALPIEYMIPSPSCSGIATGAGGAKRGIQAEFVLKATTPSLRIYLYDGTYPGADSTILTVTGIYQGV